MRSVDSANTTRSVLGDGRIELTISHALLDGVTPRMLQWWFTTLSEDMEWKGRWVPRYHIWHPVDHISVSVVSRSPDGSIGPGSKFHIIEAFGGNMDYLLDQVVDVPRLDEGGISLELQRFGSTIMRLDHTFAAEGGGTRYHSCMRLGAESGLIIKPLSHLIRNRIFSDNRASAWLKHNVEEVGNLPHFLPALYDRRGR